jgi:chromosome segregation ATPase
MTALASYKSQGDGPQLYSALENALLQDVSPSVQSFGAQVLAQLTRHIASWREENQQLERDLEAARDRDEQATVSAADQKRQYEDQLAQSTQELSEMRSELQGELNANKSELERLTSDLTTMNLKHEIRVKNSESDLEWARRRTEDMEASIRDRQQHQLELQLRMEQGADELLTTERGFHQEERALLSQQKELMSKVVQLQRELVQKKTTHMQQMFTVENEHAKQVDDARAAHADFVRKLRAQAKSDLAMLRLVHQRKKSAAQTQLAELDEQVTDLRARLTTCDANDDAAKSASAASSSSTTGRDLFRALSMTLTAAVTDASKADTKSTPPAPKTVSEAKDETANDASTSAADAPKPRDTSMCAQS